MEKEIWKDIKGYEGAYQVSSLGRIKSLERAVPVEDRFVRRIKERIIKHAITLGYPVVALRKGNKATTFYVHRLVAEAFIPNEENKPQVNHKDGVKNNNVSKNLEWVTASENSIHAWDNNLNPKPNANKNGNLQGEKVESSKLKEEDVLFIRKNARKKGGVFSSRQLAERFGVGKGCIYSVLEGRTWKHIKTFREEEIK